MPTWWERLGTFGNLGGIVCDIGITPWRLVWVIRQKKYINPTFFLVFFFLVKKTMGRTNTSNPFPSHHHHGRMDFGMLITLDEFYRDKTLTRSGILPQGSANPSSPTEGVPRPVLTPEERKKKYAHLLPNPAYHI